MAELNNIRAKMAVNVAENIIYFDYKKIFRNTFISIKYSPTDRACFCELFTHHLVVANGSFFIAKLKNVLLS
jgi:hypothetical protein